MSEPTRRRLDSEQRAALDDTVEGGLSAYVRRLREGFPTAAEAHQPMFFRRRDSTLGYSGCSCGKPGCNVPYLIEWGDRALDSYEAKIGDLTRETQRTSALMAAIRRVCRPIVLALQGYHGQPEAPLYSGDFFAVGFPPEEREALRSSLDEHEWKALTSMRLQPGRTGVLVPGEREPTDSDIEEGSEFDGPTPI